MGKYTGKKCRLLSMLWLTAILFIVEIVVGYITNSMSLVADSFHMLSDVAALAVAFLSVKVFDMSSHCGAQYCRIFCLQMLCFGYRCRPRNGRRIRLDGRELKCLVLWSTPFFLSLFVSVSPLKRVKDSLKLKKFTILNF